MVMTLAFAANGKTGEGIAGQETIAAMMGMSGRSVRRLLAELEQAAVEGRSPVRVVRQARFLPAGRGRTSDTYKLELTNRTQESSYSAGPTGHQGPVEDTTNRTESTRLTGQPGMTNRTPVSRDQRSSDQRRDQRSTAIQLDPGLSTTRTKTPKTTKRAAQLPSDWTPSEAHQAFATKHSLDLDLEVVKFRGHAEANARLAKSWNGAFTTWLANSVTFGRRGSGGTAPKVQRGMAEGIKLGTASYLEAGE